MSSRRLALHSKDLDLVTRSHDVISTRLDYSGLNPDWFHEDQSFSHSASEPRSSPSALSHSSKVDFRLFYVNLSCYTKIKRLGVGASGSVFLATHNSTHERVAIKEFDVDLRNKEDRLYFEREVEILASIRHPTLLTLHGCTPFEEEGDQGPCIVTPYMSGGSVQQLIDLEQENKAPSSWNPTRKLIVLLGVAVGMMFLHEKRIIHRDLKPANVLLDDDLEPKICDFGLSKFVESGQSRFQTRRGGTARFMAPEIYAAQPYGFEVDVYAFGIMMYLIVTGLEPFHNVKNQLALAQRVIKGERPSIPSWVAPCYCQLIQQCWMTDPKARPTFKDIVYCLSQDVFLQDGVIIKIFKDYQLRIVPPSLQPRPSLQTHGPGLPSGRSWTPIESLREMADSGDTFACVQFGNKLLSGDGIHPDPIQAVQYFKRAARGHNIDGVVCLGKCYYKGTGIAQDYVQAARLFKKAADQKDIEGLFQFGRVLHYALGANRDDVQAAVMWKKAADLGHVKAQSKYGGLLERGQGVVKNIQEAVRYYKMSAEQACPIGMFNLADMYHRGRYVEKNLKEAIRLYRLAAEDGIPKASYALCELFRYGEDEIRPNLELAVEFAQQSAERGNFLGMVQFAGLLEKGIGIAKNVDQAEQLYEEAHSVKWANEQNNYAIALTEGKGCRQDLPLAAKYYRIAASNGNEHAMTSLARLYWDGLGVERDAVQTARLLEKAAQLGYEPAIYGLANCFRNGFGIKQDYQEAVKYYRRAADKGNSDAMVNLGRMYQLGQGLTVDMTRAVKWYQMAAQKRNKSGLANLGRMWENGLGVEKDYQKALELYDQAMKLGSGLAAYLLAMMYRDGKGLTKDVSQARKLLQSAETLGYALASQALHRLSSSENCPPEKRSGVSDPLPSAFGEFKMFS